MGDLVTDGFIDVNNVERCSMPLKIQAGLSRKQGLPDYGSVGASCHVELEVDGGLLDRDQQQFQEKVRGAFVACSRAVAEELHRQDQVLRQAESLPGSGESPRSNGTRRSTTGGRRQITEKQIEFAAKLASKVQQLGADGLDAFCERCFGKSLRDLSSFQGSQLIDQLKAVKDGSVDLHAPNAVAR